MKKVNGPLDGIKVVECSHLVMGSVAGSILGDLGADVIKIEERLRGDPIRGMKLIYGQEVKNSWVFEHCNRNTRSVALDLNTEKGKEIIYKLVEKADIFLHNFQAGVAEKLKIDYETLLRINPLLIYAEGSGWGRKGPLAAAPGNAPIMEARSGIVLEMGDPAKEPIIMPGPIGDVTGGIVLVPSILAALQARNRFNIGQKVSVSGFASLMLLQCSALSCLLIGGSEHLRTTRAKVNNPIQNHYKCGDGKWITLGMTQSDRYWPNFCKAIDMPELRDDPKFKDSEARRKNRRKLISILDKKFLTRTREEWLKHFESQGEMIYGPVQTIPELVTDPQVIANEYIMDYNHPTYGPIKLLGFPYKFSETPATVRRPAPQFGQHTEEVLLEMGYNWEDITKFKDQNVI